MLLCVPEAKAELETINGVKQLDHLTELVTVRRISELRESHVTDLQRLAVDGIYACGGTYRDALTRITISGSRHVPP